MASHGTTMHGLSVAHATDGNTNLVARQRACGLAEIIAVCSGMAAGLVVAAHRGFRQRSNPACGISDMRDGLACLRQKQLRTTSLIGSPRRPASARADSQKLSGSVQNCQPCSQAGEPRGRVGANAGAFLPERGVVHSLGNVCFATAFQLMRRNLP
jgi:hypothetical protein